MGYTCADGTESSASFVVAAITPRLEACRAVIALPELEPDFTDKEVLRAYLQDGKARDDKGGAIANRHS